MRRDPPGLFTEAKDWLIWLMFMGFKTLIAVHKNSNRVLKTNNKCNLVWCFWGAGCPSQVLTLIRDIITHFLISRIPPKCSRRLVIGVHVCLLLFYHFLEILRGQWIRYSYPLNYIEGLFLQFLSKFVRYVAIWWQPSLIVPSSLP